MQTLQVILYYLCLIIWTILFMYNFSQVTFYFQSLKIKNVNDYFKLSHSPRNENLNLLVGIKFLNLFLYISKIKTEIFSGLNKVLLVLGWRTCAYREDCSHYLLKQFKQIQQTFGNKDISKVI